MAPKFLITMTFICVLTGCASTNSGTNDVPGFVTIEKDGRLWVFKPESYAEQRQVADFEKAGEPAVHYTSIGGGPNGVTVKAAKLATLNEYLAALNN